VPVVPRSVVWPGVELGSGHLDGVGDLGGVNKGLPGEHLDPRAPRGLGQAVQRPLPGCLHIRADQVPAGGAGGQPGGRASA
jgi:hypothetical protein